MDQRRQGKHVLFWCLGEQVTQAKDEASKAHESSCLTSKLDLSRPSI